jgi:hypothetical protein
LDFFNCHSEQLLLQVPKAKFHQFLRSQKSEISQTCRGV